MAKPHSGTALRGRRSECEALDQLLADVRAERSRVLVLRGEAGIGKSALLEYLRLSASRCRIERAAGVESEMELAFAGLHQLCAPMLDRLSRLPGPQRDALSTVFGLSAGAAADRFLVGLAVLSLLSDVAERRPLVCLVEDTQWLDQESKRVLAFVARRLHAESVALVFALREPGDELELANLPEMVVGGLGDDDARALLDSAVPGRLDVQVRDRIVAESRGNPLALLEFSHRSTATDLAGGFGLPDTRPLASVLEQRFLRRINALPVETQRLLRTAAAEPVGDVTLLWHAAERLGIGAAAASPAETAGLIELGARVLFRHPLVRSAAYRSAAAEERREVHRALAEVTNPDADPDRRAWHRARAAVSPDEEVAGELERSAERAKSRGGIAAAAAFLERATALTPDLARRAERALAAAQAMFETGAPAAATELLAAAETGPPNELQRARITRLRARIVFTHSRGGDAPPLLLEAAERFAPLDRTLARETYLEALGAAVFAGRLGSCGVRAVAERARTQSPGPHPARPHDLLLDAAAMRFTEGYAAGVVPLQQALQAFRHAAGRGEDGITRWLWLAWLVAGDLWDDETWRELAFHAVRSARETGALAVLPVVLQYSGGVHVHAGEFATAQALIDESDGITAATGNAPVRYTQLVLDAWRGEEAETLERIESGIEDATARGEGRVIGLVGYVTAVLYNGFGRYGAALAGAQRGCEHEDLVLYGWSLVELIEAGTRSGDREVADEALRRLEERAGAAGTDWALGMLARSRALLSAGRTAESLYREAIERLQGTRIVVHLARARLLYGEWLRREGRRLDARKQLRSAYEMLDRMGAEAFAERARRELQATGETVRKRAVGTRQALTPQEAQIARLAADGNTNPEIGSRLFISPRTVEYHLRKVYTHLAINSRRELRGALARID